MDNIVLVDAGDTSFYAEISGQQGPSTVGLNDAMSFEGVRDTITAIAGELAAVWSKVQPSEARVEFGLKMTAKSGKLTGLLVEGGGEATLMVTLTWADGSAAAAR